jgi:hypothetical protein
VIALLDLQMNVPDPRTGQCLQMVSHEASRLTPPASRTGQGEAQDFGLVEGSARYDKARRLDLSAEEQPVHPDCRVGQKAVELLWRPGPGESRGVNVGKTARVIMRDRGDAGGGVRQPEPLKQSH